MYLQPRNVLYISAFKNEKFDMELIRISKILDKLCEYPDLVSAMEEETKGNSALQIDKKKLEPLTESKAEKVVKMHISALNMNMEKYCSYFSDLSASFTKMKSFDSTMQTSS